MRGQKGYLLISLLLAALIIGLVIGGYYLSRIQSVDKEFPEASTRLKNLEQLQSSQKTINTQRSLACDLNQDSSCDDLDFTEFKKDFGKCNSELLKGDVNMDGCVNQKDQTILFGD
jgi:hypothetical protein